MHLHVAQGVRFVAAWLWTLAIATVGICLCCVIGPTKTWLAIRKPWGQVTLWLLNIRVRLIGEENLRRPGLVVSNHASLIDVVVLPALLPRKTKFVSKRSLLWVPIWGWMFGMGGAVFIDRERPSRAMRKLTHSVKQLPQDWSLVIFPEGRRSRDGTLGRFKRGVLHLARQMGDRPIVPVGLDGVLDIVSPDRWFVRGGEIRVAIGCPIEAKDLEGTPADNLAVCRAAVAHEIRRAQALREERL